VGGEKVARPIVSKCLVDQSSQPESDGSMQRLHAEIFVESSVAALSVWPEARISTAPQNNPFKKAVN
jgi:hypothetical protein